ncbi:MAG: NUDIX hydrolase [Acidimicrobiia bacterium]
MSRASTPTVRAAGGIVVRHTPKGTLVLLVHRPRYDDWSLPKGKAEPGENWEETARREVEEETGLRCRLGSEVGRTAYVDSRGRDKEVRYYLMEPKDPDQRFEPNDEVDEIHWCSPDDATALLTYDHDRRLLASVVLEDG